MIEYITTRNLNFEGKEGWIRILKLKENEFAEVHLICPNCKKETKWKEKWEPPFVKGSGKNQKFFIQCKNCGFKFKLEKLQKEIKKKR